MVKSPVPYSEFYTRFGGSARRKNVATREETITNHANKRLYVSPPNGELPEDFIRLCPWEMEYLYCVARRARKGIVEIGRFLGGTSFVLSAANPNVPIWSIDIAPQDDADLLNLFQRTGVGSNVQLIVGDSGIERSTGDYDLLFIDGDHTYEGCLRDLLTWYPKLSIPGHLVLHDCYVGHHGVQDAVLDFLDGHYRELQVIQTPFIGAHHWHYPAGSLAHLMRRV